MPAKTLRAININIKHDSGVNKVCCCIDSEKQGVRSVHGLKQELAMRRLCDRWTPQVQSAQLQVLKGRSPVGDQHVNVICLPMEHQRAVGADRMFQAELEFGNVAF